ncbi:MAG: SH3 domain-containing protein [Humidesulfovibrio sp.]|uniref:SH3 domain-containing protein n=1 Tax=Humidesulfovibrio sp. TaxID=2910988 RepID=UPI002734F396|nr:SH3 domain-containing protein [Humidesulfovibrio sp.]MDP2848638.1 SH3 domain-containing protein [Humidesulfovibrio sp.]
MNKSAPIIAAVAGTLLLAAPALAQEKLYVASEGAKLKADKSASSDTVAELPVGTALSVQGQEESWYKVSTGGKTGWIYRGKVAATPPEASKQGGDNLFGGAGSSTIMVSEADSARSMRGLNASEQEAAKAAGRPVRPLSDYKQALDRVLAEKVDKKELENFLKAGRIGEYAK